jgi:lipopolysaccharide biosynthesis glycosyltransferase
MTLKGHIIMNILVALDSNYVNPLTVMLNSIMCSNPVADFSVYVAHSSLTDEDFKKIEASVDAARCQIIPVFIPDTMLAHAPTAKRISKETYYRLIAAQYLPKSVNKILYLDPDIVVINPLYRLYNIDMGKNFFAGASHVGRFLNHLSTKRLLMDKDSSYINAGVLLMNIAELRRRQSIPYMFRFIKKNESKLYLADQDVLNSLYFRDTIEIDPLLYNLDEKTFSRGRKLSGGKNIDLDWVEKNTCIVHFNGKNKPWKQEEYKGSLDVFYKKYCDF